MVNLADLLLPILATGVAVFFLSFLMWMVLPHHRKDWAALPDEDAVMKALGDVPAGQYMFPYCTGMEQMKDPAFMAKRDAGPSGMAFILPRGPYKMGKPLLQSFVYNVVVAVFVAYLATIGLTKATEGGDVFRFTATAAFMGFGLGIVWDPIWMGKSWCHALRSLFDCLVYGLATGAIFMLMWP